MTWLAILFIAGTCLVLVFNAGASIVSDNQ